MCMDREKTVLYNVAWDIYLTCLSRSELFYNKFGFTSIPVDHSVPFSLRLEYYLGSALTKWIEPKEKVLIMRRNFFPVEEKESIDRKTK